MTLPKGTVIGGFTIGPPLGQGGFGITYLAQDNQSSRKFALKEYFPSEFASRLSDGTVSPQRDTKRLFDYGLEAFIKEANILRTLPRQPGLVKVRGAFERMGTAYCAMEYIEGEPLDKMVDRFLQNHATVPQELVEAFLLPVTQALAAIHNKKLFHRDVKPGNIMIRRNGSPVLIDFGAARLYGNKGDGTVMFTRKYAPIEQFPANENRSGRSILVEGPWSDLYSLSVLLYEMVSRRVPPDAETRMNAWNATGRDPYVPIVQRVGNRQVGGNRYSPELLQLIDKGCALFPKDRPQNAQQYRSILLGNRPSPPSTARSSAQQSHRIFDVAETSPAVFPGKPVNPPKNERKRGALTMGLIILALALVATGYGMWGAY